jgi:hypothetical protein
MYFGSHGGYLADTVITVRYRLDRLSLFQIADSVFVAVAQLTPPKKRRLSVRR